MIDSRCYAPNTINIICVSGGKDSLATWLLAKEMGVNIVPVFADTGHESAVTMDYLDYLESKLGVLTRVRADFSKQIARKREFIKNKWPITLVSECGLSNSEAQERIEQALETLVPTNIPFLDLCMLKGRFPSTKARFCTFELKTTPVFDFVIKPSLNTFDEVISWHGVRAQESPRRAKLQDWESDVDGNPGLNVYRPIFNWTHEQVFDYAKIKGIEPNPLYKQGFTRVGCFPCIHARKSELAEIFQRYPNEVQRVAAWEQLVAKCSRWGNSTFYPSTMDPFNRERRIECVNLDSHGIESYRDWALTTRGGCQFDLLASENEFSTCASVYFGVCE